MSVERAAAVEPVNRPRLRESSPSSGVPVQLRIADHPVRDRVQRLVTLALSLLNEAQNLARDKAFAEASAQLRSLNMAEGIDFYKEVERFEIELIRLALDRTHGCQAKAAKLLQIKPTTLNSKIKMLGIEY
jgi:transcriptional regulator with GAF, ATPase, and Fis domain